MHFPLEFSSSLPARLAKGITASLATCLFVLAVGCSDTDDPAGTDTLDASTSPAIPAFDGGGFSFDAGNVLPPITTFDAGTVRPSVDATVPDAASQPVSDGGAAKPDAAAVADGGLTIPDLFPKPDAGPTTTTDAGSGTRNVNGPCKDLNLLCFDFVDMWINAECATCNAGKGCQGCAIPFAY